MEEVGGRKRGKEEWGREKGEKEHGKIVGEGEKKDSRPENAQGSRGEEGR